MLTRGEKQQADKPSRLVDGTHAGSPNSFNFRPLTEDEKREIWSPEEGE